jgi:hypothetical protein
LGVFWVLVAFEVQAATRHAPVMADARMMVATLLITSAVLILRKAKRKPTQSPPELPRDDAPQL